MRGRRLRDCQLSVGDVEAGVVTHDPGDSGLGSTHEHGVEHADGQGPDVEQCDRQFVKGQEYADPGEQDTAPNVGRDHRPGGVLPVHPRTRG